MPFEIVRNDITKMKVDAIVNAANNSLLGGGGVDGAIHRAAGPELLEECRTLGGCETGSAKITKGYRLQSKYVIHTVGPIWQGGQNNEENLLISCYQTSLELAVKHKCETVAFPLISAGAYGYPKDQAIKVATDTIRDFLLKNDMMVFLVVFDRSSFAISQKLYANIQAFIDDAYIGPDYERSEELRRVDNIRPFMAPSSAPLAKPKSEAKKPSIFPRKQKKEEALPNDVLLESECAMAPSLDDYLNQIDEGFRDMLLRKIDERHMTDAECYKRANIDRKLFNKIKNQADYKPSKSTVAALAIALHLPLEEVREMLMKAGFSFTHSSKFDLIVEYFIAQGNYDIFEINQALFAFDQKLLGSVM